MERFLSQVGHCELAQLTANQSNNHPGDSERASFTFKRDFDSNSIVGIRQERGE